MKLFAFSKISVIVVFVSCINSKNVLHENTFNSSSPRYNIDSVLKDSAKIALFHSQFRKTYFRDVPSEYIDVRCVVGDTLAEYIGLFSYRESSPHTLYKLYFLNCFDSIVFIDKKDTLNWNSQIEKFIFNYQKYITPSKIDRFKKEILK